MAKPAGPEKEARRAEILDAALAEFLAKGFNGASMERIARQARASKETLYAWFKNKEALFDSAFSAQHNKIGREAQLNIAQKPEPWHVLPIVARDTVRFTLKMAPLLQIATEKGKGSDRMLNAMAEQIRPERASFHLYLEWCRAQGYIAYDAASEEIASIFIGMALAEWQLRVGYGLVPALTDAMLDEHAQRVTAMFLKALAPSEKASLAPSKKAALAPSEKAALAPAKK